MQKDDAEADSKKKDLISSLGVLEIKRGYYECRSCKCRKFLADRYFAIGTYTLETRRRICGCVAQSSGEIASRDLRRFHEIRVSANTAMEVAMREGQKMKEFQRTREEAAQKFIKAKGVVELTMDGVMINTVPQKKLGENETSWREVKVLLTSRRVPGAPSSPETWESRVLPPPTATVGVVAIETAAKFVRRLPQWAKQYHIHDLSQLHVLADGGRWIWNGVKKCFVQFRGCLDYFHACEHINLVVERLYGKFDPVWRQRAKAWRFTLLKSGWAGLEPLFSCAKSEVPAALWESDGKREYEYFSNYRNYLNYAERLASGYSIGSGQVEGACKQLVMRRLRQTGARWRIQRVNRLLGLVTARYTDCDCAYFDYQYALLGIPNS